MKNFLQGLLLIIVAYLLISYADTEEFQSLMDALFIGATPFIPEQYWLEERLLVIRAIVLLLIAYYFTTWVSYKNLIKIYNSKSPLPTKPTLTVQQANYIYLQDKLTTLKVWILDCCQNNFLNLHYKKSINPWTLKRNPAKIPPYEFEQKLIDTLFADESEKNIRDNYSDPDQQFEQLANTLFRHTQTNNSHLMRTKSSSFFAWLILIILFIEIPFLNNFFPDVPAMIMLSLVMTASTALFIYGISYNLQSYFNNSRLIAYFITALFLFIAVIIHYFILKDLFNMSYFTVQFYLDIVVSIAILVAKCPLLPKDSYFLEQIIGYQNYLQNKQDGIDENELIWALALDADINLFKNYNNNKYPGWLVSYDDRVKVVIPELQESLSTSLKNAIYGIRKQKSHRSSGSSSMGDKY